MKGFRDGPGGYLVPFGPLRSVSKKARYNKITTKRLVQMYA